MSLPRNDSASIMSSLQMDYGDSEEEDNDSKQNSYTDFKESDNDSSGIEIKVKPIEDVAVADHNEVESSLPKEAHDTKPNSVEAVDSPIDNISDDEHDSHHHHRHHHHHHKSHRDSDHQKDILSQKEIMSEAVATDSPASQGSTKPSKKATALVSYGPDEDVGSEGEESEEEEDDEGGESNGDSPVLNATDASILSRSVQNMSGDDITIPPEPPGKCPYKLQEKIEREYERMKRESVDHNRNMQEKKNFRNPSIYEKLIDFCHIDENGTNFPPEIYNPHVWGKDSFFDELDKAQRKDMEKREKEKKERTKIEFMTGTKKLANAPDIPGAPDEKKRKTKWDAQPGGNIQVQYAKLPSAQQNPGVVNLTATATGTKGKVISAVGSLSKKSSSK